MTERLTMHARGRRRDTSSSPCSGSIMGGVCPVSSCSPPPPPCYTAAGRPRRALQRSQSPPADTTARSVSPTLPLSPPHSPDGERSPSPVRHARASAYSRVSPTLNGDSIIYNREQEGNGVASSSSSSSAPYGGSSKSSSFVCPYVSFQSRGLVARVPSRQVEEQQEKEEEPPVKKQQATKASRSLITYPKRTRTPRELQRAARQASRRSPNQQRSFSSVIAGIGGVLSMLTMLMSFLRDKNGVPAPLLPVATPDPSQS